MKYSRVQDKLLSGLFIRTRLLEYVGDSQSVFSNLKAVGRDVVCRLLPTDGYSHSSWVLQANRVYLCFANASGLIAVCFVRPLS